MNDDTCAFPDGCDKSVEVKRWRLCKKHYVLMRRKGTIDTARTARCQKDGCKHAAKVLGWCRPHVLAERIAGHIPRDCEYGPCDRPRHGEEYCRAHENQVKRGQPIKPLQQREARTGTCPGAAGECGDEIVARGLCRAHWYQRSKGLPLKKIDRDSPNLKGQPCLTCAGYGEVRISATMDGQCQTHAQRRRGGQVDWERSIKHKAPDGTVLIGPKGYRLIGGRGGRSRYEHRVLAEQALGRPLLPSENIHHVNGDRADNRTDGPFVMDDRGRLCSGNLEIWNTMQPAGQQVGAKVAYSVEILAQYGDVAALWEADLDVLERVLAAHGRMVARSRQRA